MMMMMMMMMISVKDQRSGSRVQMCECCSSGGIFFIDVLSRLA